MIAVIADDLTGAAEIGGLGLRYNLAIEIVCGDDLRSDADLLIISTDTRSMPEEQALKATELLTKKLAQIKPALVFKKVDSVLRGHVMGELTLHMRYMGLKRAFLIPANPALGRTIENSRYHINGQPIHLTSFVDDPEFSITSSEISDMLRADKTGFRTYKINDELPENGIIVGECVTDAEITAWVNRSDKETLLAGGAGLFKAQLRSLNLRTSPRDNHNIRLAHPALFICGTKFEKSIASVAQINANGGPVSFMPSEIVNLPEPPEELFDAWADQITALLNVHSKAIVAIRPDTLANTAITAAGLRNKKAVVVKKVFERIAVKELLIEGGSTAAAIINRLKFSKLFPLSELGPGVIKLTTDKRDELFLTLKPGSYDWPADTWNF